MRKISIVLVLVLGFAVFSGYRALAADDIVDDVEVVETITCPMHQDRVQDSTRPYGRMGRMMNGFARRNRVNENFDPENCPCLNQDPVE
ncbi:MAG: hypothetical protein KGZ84_09635 [Erysipelotrichia bacterium]|jgi:hypothetical protein|nr:hypothetical protein [Erysipelotrichia bacterium]